MMFLPGWGQSSRIWQAQAAHFSRIAPVLTPELPGHGGAADAAPASWLEAIAAQLPREPVVLVGWSLGGMLALQLANAMPEQVAALALVSTTPCFRTHGDWAHGCEDSTFRAFAQGVADCSQTGSPKALARFFALMLQGDALPRRRYNELAHAAIDRQRPPTPAGLAAGLELLESLDLRPQLSGIGQPAWVAHGDRDTIIPPAAGRFLAESLPHADWHLFEACGHAPFLTQAGIFNAGLEAWCRTISSPNG
jgi:pimeloyl-[acyl-carrier protein] methyl ester esterase